MSVTAKQKDIERNFRVYRTGYCKLQYLLSTTSPVYDTKGTYGWNADVYILSPHIALATGYRPFGKQIPYSLVDKYESQAKKIRENYSLPLNEKINKINNLLAKFTKELEKI